MTADWPWTVGSMLTRRSKWLPWIDILIRPSCGRRFSEMSMLPMILIRDEQRGQQPARRAVALDQHAVDPVADPDAVGERLDVDVAGPQA